MDRPSRKREPRDDPFSDACSPLSRLFLILRRPCNKTAPRIITGGPDCQNQAITLIDSLAGCPSFALFAKGRVPRSLAARNFPAPPRRRAELRPQRLKPRSLSDAGVARVNSCASRSSHRLRLSRDGNPVGRFCIIGTFPPSRWHVRVESGIAQPGPRFLLGHVFLKSTTKLRKEGKREKFSRHEHQEFQRSRSMGRDVLRLARHRGRTAPGQTLGRAVRIRFPGAPQEHPNFPSPGKVHDLQDGTLLPLHHQNPKPRLQEGLVRFRRGLRNSRRRLVHPP
jgi:hypothetical protein